MKKIAIIGATSFIGRNLIEPLVKDDWDVVAVVRTNSVKRGYLERFSNIKILECDMSEYDKLGNLLGPVDCSIYLTWDGTRGQERSNYELQLKNYTQGMLAIQSIIENGCKKILTAGSQAEYGPWFQSRNLCEFDKENPNTEYGKFKLKFYKDIKSLCDNHKVKLIEPRFFSLYGPDDYEGTMIISILKKMLHNEPCDLTECKQIWDFLYITDAINGLMLLINKNIESGVYNFGFGEGYPLKYYIEKMYSITKSKSILNYGTIPYPITGMVNVNPCIDKLKSVGWTPKISFTEGINRIVNVLK
ncbi:NAD-dependent epimerase/dehydratase family protein [Megasphaera stantonii]|uniref:NAD(P)-dependent oxidoreductase n=1 Tax=Megasphaera stantonii TaxID=2144175 RepID=A0A346B1U2_9FIRM|nr:NAD(P)-dependent oxidoreductase [Megasphaera stantonii]AXL22085.1 NAD(P)-dependent oxidoreductase [Megasphaera stantonii]